MNNTGKLLITFIISLFVLTACKSASTPSADYPFEGKWKGRAEVTTQWEGCYGADLKATVKRNSLSGEAETDDGYELKIAGTIDKEGNIKAGFAAGGTEVSTFEGVFTEDGALGKWYADGGCSGYFNLER